MKSLKELKKGNKFKINKYLFILLCFLILSVTVGYSALQQTLEISGKAAYRVPNIMRITDLSLDSASNGGIEEYNSNYFKDSMTIGISLPNQNSTVTYKVEISNLGNIKQWVDSINLSNSDNIAFTISELNIRKDLFYPGDSKTFYITFKYKDGANIDDYTLKYDLTVNLNFIEPISNLRQRAPYTFEEIMSDEDGKIQEKYFSDDSLFYEGPIKNGQINSISFTNTLFLDGYDGYFDMSVDNSGTVLGYYKKVVIDNEDRYDITIGGLGEIIAPSDSSLMFAYLSNLTSLKFNGYFNPNNINNLCGLLMMDINLNTLDINNLNILGKYSTKNVTNTSFMFGQCISLTSLNLSNFNTSNVTNMSNMFALLTHATKIIFSDNSNNAFTTKNVTNMSGMFGMCIRLSTLNLSTFDTSKVTDMNNMFASFHTNDLTLDLSTFDTSKVTNMENMFSNCNITKLIVGDEFNTSKVTNMRFMFQYLGINDNTDDLYGENEYLKTLYKYQIENINDVVSHITFESLNYAYAMFGNEPNDNDDTNIIPIDTLNINNSALFIKDDEWGIDYMFNTKIKTLNLTGFEFPNITKKNLFSGGIIGTLTWKNAKWYNVNLSGGNFTKIILTNMDLTGLTSLKSWFSGHNTLTTIDLSGWDVSNITDFSDMFSGDSNLTEIDLSSFNVSTKVTYNRMFDGCTNIEKLHLNNWDFTINDILEGVSAQTIYANKKYQSYLENKYPNQTFVFVES